MLKPRSPQESFYGSYLYNRIVPIDHPLRKINQVVDLSFADEILKDRYNQVIGRPAEDPEFLLRLCLLQYLYGDSDRQVVENARLNLAYKYFLGLAVDAEVPEVNAGEHDFPIAILAGIIQKFHLTGKDFPFDCQSHHFLNHALYFG